MTHAPPPQQAQHGMQGNVPPGMDRWAQIVQGMFGGGAALGGLEDGWGEEGGEMWAEEEEDSEGGGSEEGEEGEEGESEEEKEEREGEEGEEGDSDEDWGPDD